MTYKMSLIAQNGDYGSVLSESRQPLISLSDSADESSTLLPTQGIPPPETRIQDACGRGGYEFGTISSFFSSYRRCRVVLIISSLVTCIIVTSLLFINILTPFAAEKYAQDAFAVNIDSVSIESFSGSGATARFCGQLNVDASKVKVAPVRLLGTLVTSILRTVYVKSSSVDVILPDYVGGSLGRATYPNLAIDVRDRHSTYVNFTSLIEHGPLDVLKTVVDDLVSGKVDSLRLKGSSMVGLKAGILPLGTYKLSHLVSLNKLPSIPPLNITQVTMGEINSPDASGIEANVSAIAANDYPLFFEVPPMAFDVFLPACRAGLVQFASVQSPRISVEPYRPITADFRGRMYSIPDLLTRPCPDTKSSPIDEFLAGYMRGAESRVYVQIPAPTVGEPGVPGFPDWIVEFLRGISIPVPVPKARLFDDLVKSFTLTDVDFSLPSPTAPPGSPDSFPRLSASIDALIAFPDEVTFPIKVSKIRADANLLYRGRKFGEIHTGRLVPAKSVKTEQGLRVSASFSKVPLNVTDTDVFSEVVQKVLFGKENGVELDIQGTADAMIEPAQLGSLVVRGIPAQGQVFIDRGRDLDALNPNVTDLSIVRTTPSSFTFSSRITFENPTDYKAFIPYLNVNVYTDGVLLGNFTARNSRLEPGKNSLLAETIWSPPSVQVNGSDVGSKFLGDYVSGKNLSISLRIHEQSIPSLPDICKKLENLDINVPLPHPPSNFIESTFLHVLSSTASFILNNPLSSSPIYLSRLTGYATHNGSILGTINSTYPLKIPPGNSETPRLPIEYHGISYDIVRKALGGILKVDANAQCDVQIEEFGTKLHIEVAGVGAQVTW